jgi:predicted PurR-regulated permease PerM|tara:strand:- start:1152 stop:2186 length:1035 start_codon:yes stop_codon:yes gene_type:complete
MAENYLRKVGALVILAVLMVLSFLILKPILLAITMGVIFAVVFASFYDRIFKLTNSKNFSATIICFVLVLIIILPIWFLTPIFIKQSFEVFLFAQQMDFVTPLKSIFPSIFASEEFSEQIGSILFSFVNNLAGSMMNSFSKLILNFPIIFFQLIVVFFTLFFFLRDKDQLFDYVKSLSPFSKDVEHKLFKSSKEITLSVIYGQVFVGILQGIITGIGFFIFGVNNALFFGLLAILAGIFPVIGTTIVWLPIAIFLLIAGNTFSAMGVGVFGIFSASIDNILRPLIVSKRTRMHPLILLIGMIGGLFFFGILGFILGPLILAYILIILETYRSNTVRGVFVQPED